MMFKSGVFLYGVLKEEVFLWLTPSYVDDSRPWYVGKLDKNMYGLKYIARSCMVLLFVFKITISWFYSF
jgi:hypothetical protein